MEKAKGGVDHEALYRHEPWNPKILLEVHVEINIKDYVGTWLGSNPTSSTSLCTNLDKGFVSPDLNFHSYHMETYYLTLGWFRRIIFLNKYRWSAQSTLDGK